MKHRLILVMTNNRAFQCIMGREEYQDFMDWLDHFPEPRTFYIHPIVHQYNGNTMAVDGKEFLLTDPSNIIFIEDEIWKSNYER